VHIAEQNLAKMFDSIYRAGTRPGRNKTSGAKSIEEKPITTS
jgi:hypothetical protein